ncbi:MAG TPA: branched-chain amino acid ABC transporter permease [Elusimicrobia bacterium]|nr:MAG: ABC transporter permease [Elusimicrobia bacterium GWA2_66_18]HAZ08967.1 branched-chain amino acid ABC transporter permease [Elusimicrobiota bacterium]
MLAQQILNALTLGAIYSLIALGYTLVYGILAMINFAHSEVLMLGAFTALGLATFAPAAFGSGPSALAAMFVAGMAAAGLVNVVVERFAYRPLRAVSRLAPLISAIGVSIVLQNGVFLWISTQSLSFPRPVVIGQISLFGASVSSLQLVILGAALGLMGLLHFFVESTKMGKAMRACADDISTAGLMGIDADRVIAVTFFVGGALGGAAGVLYGMNYGSIKYNLGFLPGAKAFTAAVLGGIGNIRGAVLGGFILGLLEVLACGYIPDGAQWRDVIAFTVLIVVLLVRPSGLLGEKMAEKV